MIDQIRERQHAANYGVQTGSTNVGQTDRMISGFVGGTLVLKSLLSRSVESNLMLVAGGFLLYRGITGHCPISSWLEQSWQSGGESEHEGVEAQQGVKGAASIQIQRPRSDVYQYWKNLTNLPNLFSHLETVESLEGNRSHWVAKTPVGRDLQWDAEIINEKENQLIAWQSVGESDIRTAGSVHFEDSEGGTLVTIAMKYDPPGGKASDAVAGLVGADLESQLEEGLELFKQEMETEASKGPDAQPTPHATKT